MSNKTKINIFWFRRDLRLNDNAGLAQALNDKYPVVPIFIFDKNILENFEDKKDRRVDYIQQALVAMNKELKRNGSTLITFYGQPQEVFENLMQQYDIQNLFANRDYEPSAIDRDKGIYKYLKTQNIPFKGYKDQVIFDKDEILTQSETPYKVYTPYSRKWKSTLTKKDYAEKKINFENFHQTDFKKVHSLEKMGYQKTNIEFQKPLLDASIIDTYDKTRDTPSANGTTRLGMPLRFGTIGIRECVRFALKHNETWLSELIWRDFFMQILYHYPKVVDHSFKRKYDFIEWRNNEQEFQCWCNGKTGYPIVDAGMRELNETGYMHNRVRMIVASFLCKDLLIDWRWGEAYFAQKLNDYDLSANNGNWQWASGAGCDAAPYFRVFNPTTQSKKFDKEMQYIKKWVPEVDTKEYVEPIVDHKMARDRALEVYKKAVKED